MRRRRRRKQRDEGAFESINITPFTDVLLVLLIIFLIAGSSFSPSGVEVDKLAKVASGISENSEEKFYTLIVDDDGEVFELRGEERFSVDLARLKKERSLFLTAGPNTKTQNVVAVYDRLLQMRFRKVYLAAPAASPVE